MVIEPGLELRIGVSASLSGATAVLGDDIRDAVTLAVEDFGGHIRSFPVSVVAVDDGCTDADQAVSAANQLVSDPLVVAVVGPMCSNGAQAANPIYERAGLIHVSSSASMPALSEGQTKLFFRTAWRDDHQGAALAAYALDALGLRTAVTIDDGNSYSESVAVGFAGLFAARGGAVAASEKVAPGQRDFSGLVERILSQAPDAVLFAGFGAEAAPLLQQLREAGYQGAVLAPDSLFDLAGFVEAAGAAAEGVVVLASPPPPDDAAAAFDGRFHRPWRTPFIGHAYDAATVLLAAIESVATEEGGKLILDRRSLLDALRGQVSVGLTGPIRFDASGDRAGNTPAEIGLAPYVVKDGQFVLDIEREAAETPTPTPGADAGSTPTPAVTAIP